ncbi:MAG: hypothetical protein JXR88_02460 [Clostridia bacterium]|nr:hypothetical protein [Clostridia bacterium]
MKIKSKLFYSGIILLVIVFGVSFLSRLFQTEKMDLSDILGIYIGLIGLLSLGLLKMILYRRNMETLHFSYGQKFKSVEIVSAMIIFNTLCLLGLFKIIEVHEFYGIVVLMMTNVVILYRLALPCGISQNNLYLSKKYNFNNIESYHFEKDELEIIFTKQKFNISFYDEVKLDIPSEQHDLIEKKYLNKQ